MSIDSEHAQGGMEAGGAAPARPVPQNPASRCNNLWRLGVVIACLLVVLLISRPALMAPAAATSTVLQAPLPAAFDCVKGTLKKNGYGLVPNNAGPATEGPQPIKTAGALIGIKRLTADEVKRFAGLGILKDRGQIDYGLARISVSLSPVDARSTRVSLATSILAFMTPGIPLMRPSRLFPLRSNGGLEADFLASLKQSDCSAPSAPSPAPH